MWHSAETSSDNPSLFKVLLCLVAMHFTVNSYSFELLCLFIISLLWEAALLLPCAAHSCSVGVVIPHLDHGTNWCWTGVITNSFLNTFTNFPGNTVVALHNVETMKSTCVLFMAGWSRHSYSMFEKHFLLFSFSFLDPDIRSSRGAAGLPTCQRGRVRLLSFMFYIVMFTKKELKPTFRNWKKPTFIIKDIKVLHSSCF